MATTGNTTIHNDISPLDILWAFYQSQPKRIKKAFRSRIEAEEKSGPIPIWRQDLQAIKALKDNWDDEGAPRIHRKAIQYSEKILYMLTPETASQTRLHPTHLGAVMITIETEKGRISGEIGDTEMSYFVKQNGMPTEHHSFEPLNEENMSSLVASLEKIGQ